MWIDLSLSFAWSLFCENLGIHLLFIHISHETTFTTFTTFLKKLKLCNLWNLTRFRNLFEISESFNVVDGFRRLSSWLYIIILNNLLVYSFLISKISFIIKLYKNLRAKKNMIKEHESRFNITCLFFLC